jgi:hypothetical protein
MTPDKYGMLPDGAHVQGRYRTVIETRDGKLHSPGSVPRHSHPNDGSCAGCLVADAWTEPES